MRTGRRRCMRTRRRRWGCEESGKRRAESGERRAEEILGVGRVCETDFAFDPVGDPLGALGEEVEEELVAAADDEGGGVAEAVGEGFAACCGDPGVGGGVELEDGA